MGHPFIKVISEDPWHSHRLLFSNGAVTTCVYDLSLSRLWFENPTLGLRGERFIPLRHRRDLTNKYFFYWNNTLILLVVFSGLHGHFLHSSCPSFKNNTTSVSLCTCSYQYLNTYENVKKTRSVIRIHLKWNVFYLICLITKLNDNMFIQPPSYSVSTAMVMINLRTTEPLDLWTLMVTFWLVNLGIFRTSDPIE